MMGRVGKLVDIVKEGSATSMSSKQRRWSVAMLTVSVVAMTLRIRRSLDAEAEFVVSVDAESGEEALGWVG